MVDRVRLNTLRPTIGGSELVDLITGLTYKTQPTPTESFQEHANRVFTKRAIPIL